MAVLIKMESTVTSEMDWDRIRRFSKCGERPPEWPAGVEAISLKGVSLLGIDSENHLYWDGKMLATVKLTRWQKVGAFVLTASAMVAAIAACVQAWAAITSV